MPEPRLASAPPTPSSRTSSVRTPPQCAAASSTTVACECLAAFVSASDLRTGGELRPLPDPRHTEIVSALVQRGVREDRARKLLLDLPDDHPVLDQIEWADAEIARKQRSNDPVGNPPGFYIYLVRANYAVPANFDGRPAVYGIRPEHFVIADDGAEAIVQVIEPTGSETQIVAKLGVEENAPDIIAVFRERHQFKPGDKIRLKPDPGLVHLFDAATEQRLSA